MSGRAPRTEVLGRGQQVGIMVAAGVAPTTFLSSLSERSWMDQGLVTGLATGTQYVLTVSAQDLLDLAAKGLAASFLMPARWSVDRREGAAAMLCQGLAVPLGFGVAAWLDRSGPLSNSQAVLRQASWRIGLTGFAGSLLGAGTVATRSLDDALGAGGRIAAVPLAIPLGLATSLVSERVRQGSVTAPHATDPASTHPLLGLAVSAGVVVLVAGAGVGERWAVSWLGEAGRNLVPASDLTWRVAGHAVAVAGMVLGTNALWRTAMGRIESATSAYDEVVDSPAGEWTNRLVSGDPESLVPWTSLGREGRRHVTTFVRPRPLTSRPVTADGREAPDLSIPTVMGEEAVAHPIAVYVGLDSAPTLTERVELALAEMDRTGAWSRSVLMLISPTGTGYVNYVATATAQYLTRGDLATVTMQYSKRPSPLSIGKVKDAREQNRLLWLSVAQRVRAMAPAERPKVVLFGESLGAHTSQDVLLGWGTLGPLALGIDRALWIGTPGVSKWRDEVTGAPRPDVDQDLVAVVNDYEQFCERSPEARRKVRFILVSHDNDGVTKFDPDLLMRRPAWLGGQRPAVEEIPGRSPRGTPPAMRWRPVTTFFQTLIDMKNAQIPGAYRAWAHDYRADLPEFVRDAFDLHCTPEQLERIKAAVQEREEYRESLFT